VERLGATSSARESAGTARSRPAQGPGPLAIADTQWPRPTRRRRFDRRRRHSRSHLSRSHRVPGTPGAVERDAARPAPLRPGRCPQYAPPPQVPASTPQRAATGRHGPRTRAPSVSVVLRHHLRLRRSRQARRPELLQRRQRRLHPGPVRAVHEDFADRRPRPRHGAIRRAARIPDRASRNRGGPRHTQGLAYRLAAAAGASISFLFWLTASWGTAPYFYGPDLPYAAGWLTLALAGHGGLL